MADMNTIERPRYSLLRQLRDPISPVMQYLNWRFPNRRPLQDDYRMAPEIEDTVVPACSDPRRYSGTIGTAFDLAVKFILQPDHVPQIARNGFSRPAHRDVIDSIIALAQQTPRDGDDFARACWALAKTTEVGRAGLMPGTDIDNLVRTDRFEVETLMALGHDEVIEQVTALVNLFLEVKPFDGARVVAPDLRYRALNADADLVTDLETLVEVKTRLGHASKRDGSRPDSLPGKDLMQVLAYVLLDFDDALGISSVGFYSARYGYYIEWDLDVFLETLAGEPVDLELERKTLRTMIDRFSDDEIPYVPKTIFGDGIPAPELFFIDASPELVEHMAKDLDCEATASAVSGALSRRLHAEHGVPHPAELADAEMARRKRHRAAAVAEFLAHREKRSEPRQPEQFDPSDLTVWEERQAATGDYIHP